MNSIHQKRYEMNQLKKKRIEKLFQDCQDTIIAQTLSAFGLTQGMFQDRDGGSVTTLHNFKQEDNKFVHERDHASHSYANSDYDRSNYEVNSTEWSEKKENSKKSGIDSYTGKKFKDESRIDLDHITPLKEIHETPKHHLAHNTGTTEGKEKLKQTANNEKNLAATDSSINRSKGAKTNTEFLETSSEERKKELGINEELMKKTEEDSIKYLNSEANKALFKKQANELLQTGGQQALAMGIKQALGLLTTEFINIIFSEIKLMTREGISFDLNSLELLKIRSMRHINKLKENLPGILVESLKGGVSGFLSNLLTFIINNFISTAKRIVTIIRESLLGIYQAFKILFFPPQGMTKQEIWSNVIKFLSSAVITAITLTFTEAITTFLKTSIPILAPIAELIASVFIGIISGLGCALVAYAIDSLLDKLSNRHDENMINILMENAQERNKLANNLIEVLGVYEQNINEYKNISKNYTITSVEFNHIQEDKIKLMNDVTDMVDNIRELTTAMKKQNQKVRDVLEYIDDTQSSLETFLAKY